MDSVESFCEVIHTDMGLKFWFGLSVEFYWFVRFIVRSVWLNTEFYGAVSMSLDYMTDYVIGP